MVGIHSQQVKFLNFKQYGKHPKCTILWHVDDLELLYVEEKESTKAIKQL